MGGDREIVKVRVLGFEVEVDLGRRCLEVFIWRRWSLVYNVEVVLSGRVIMVSVRMIICIVIYCCGYLYLFFYFKMVFSWFWFLSC